MVLEKETNLYLDNAIKNKFEQQETALSIFINEQFVPEMTNIQSQVDSKIETWYQPTDPSLSWSTDDAKALHVGDLWYNTDNNQNTTSRWNGTTWVSQNVPASVFDAIDSKAQVFVARPTPPYNIGDLWVQGYTGNILKCKASRSSGVYADSDWELASKYTDDSVFTNWLSSTFAPTLQDLTNQVDQKAETWYQSDDPELGWTQEEQAEHIGDLWYRTTDNVTLRYSDTGWVEQAAPKAVFAGAALSEIKKGTSSYKPVTVSGQHQAAFYGLAKAAGDTTQSASSNAVGTYTDEAKSAIKTMLGIDTITVDSIPTTEIDTLFA